MIIIQKLILLFSMVVIVFGFYQLQHEQDIFAQSKERCCNNGMCRYPDDCSLASKVDLKADDCDPNSYNFTCKDCVDYSAAGQACKDPINSCLDQFNNCYGWCKVNGSYQWVVSK
jgi:hypothetical protein